MSKQTDISQQIQKYLNGKLDAKAMHRLELEALNDPFLADALEGYAVAKTNQQANLADISARLQSRNDKKLKRLIPWKLISVAASVIVVLTNGGLWLANNEPIETKAKKTAMLDKMEVTKPDSESSLKAPLTMEEEKEMISAPKLSQQKTADILTNQAIAGEPNAEIRITEPVADEEDKIIEGSDKVALEDRIVDGYFSAPQANQAAAQAPVDSAAVANALQGRVAGLAVAKAGKKADQAKLLRGKVIDAGAPIPGATVRVKGTDIATQTDMNGIFTIPVVPDKSELDINYLGYLAQQVKVKRQDTVVIAMQPSYESLNEVVVVGYGTKRKNASAYPIGGWDAFKKYLKENALSPDGKKGTVKLVFVVNSDASLSDFKVLKSVSAATDEAAIQLVKKGAGWMSSADGKPQLVEVSIKFTPEE